MLAMKTLGVLSAVAAAAIAALAISGGASARTSVRQRPSWATPSQIAAALPRVGLPYRGKQVAVAAASCAGIASLGAFTPTNKDEVYYSHFTCAATGKTGRTYVTRVFFYHVPGYGDNHLEIVVSAVH